MRSRAVSHAAAVLALTAVLTAAGSVPPGAAQGPGTPLAVSVTGGPATLDALRLAITTAARTTLGLPQAAIVRVAQTQPSLAPLDASAVENVFAVLSVQPPGVPAEIRLVRVTLNNAIIPWNDAEILLVSNSPETIPVG